METSTMSLKEVAERVGLSQTAVRGLVTNGLLAARRTGRELRFEHADVERWQLSRGSAARVTEQLLPAEATGLPVNLTVFGALALPRINLELKATTRDEVLHELVALVI